ncbi:MAG: nuclear transport factor 2 family protein [Gammaproteobacteria bacterium]
MKNISDLKVCFNYLLLMTFLLAGQSVPASGDEKATSEEIRTLVKNSLQAWETGSEELLLSTAHPDMEFSFPTTRTDAQGALRVLRYWNEHYEDTKVYIHWILVDGDRFAAEYQFATTEKATGKRTAAGTVAIGRVQDGKIITLKEYVDGRVGRLQNEGELPLEEGEEPYPWPEYDKTMPWSD